MLELFAVKLCTAYSHLVGNIMRLIQKEKESPLSPVSQRYLDFVVETCVAPLVNEFHRLNLDEGLRMRSNKFLARLTDLEGHWTMESLLNGLSDMQHDFMREFGKSRFAYIAPEHAQLFGQEKPFGADVHESLPDARMDVSNAANSLAFELYTACVFHLMRAVEHGLRKLARRLKVVVMHNKKRSRLEEEDWNKIIEAVKRKAEAAHRIASRPKKREQLKLYSDLADHCLFMKNIWRNDVSHTRTPYNLKEAEAAWNRVERFMQLVAEATR